MTTIFHSRENEGAMANNFSRKSKSVIAQSALIFGLVFYLYGEEISFLSVIALPAAIWLVYQLEKDRNLMAIESALPLLNDIYAGRLYVGKYVEVVESRRLDDPRLAGPLIIEQLCKTKSEQWFKFRFSTKSFSGIPFNFDVAPCDEMDARLWLEKYPDVYRKIFGNPEIA